MIYYQIKVFHNFKLIPPLWISILITTQFATASNILISQLKKPNTPHAPTHCKKHALPWSRHHHHLRTATELPTHPPPHPYSTQIRSPSWPTRITPPVLLRTSITALLPPPPLPLPPIQVKLITRVRTRRLLPPAASAAIMGRVIHLIRILDTGMHILPSPSSSSIRAITTMLPFHLGPTRV